MQGHARQKQLNETIRADLTVAIPYVKNHLLLMDYASPVEQKLPSSLGVTEAACKTLVKQRFCCVGKIWNQDCV